MTPGFNPQHALARLRLPYPKGGLIGHRGLASVAPENTEAGFVAAARAGLSWVEFDVQRCASGQWVVFHDERLERTSNGQGLLRDKTWSELHSLSLGAWFGPAFIGERILSLNETLDKLSSLGLHPNIEVKFGEADSGQRNVMPAMAREIANIVEAHWDNQARSPALISSFSSDFLQIFRAQQPDWPLCYLVNTVDQATLNQAQDLGFDILNVKKESLLRFLAQGRSPKNIKIPLFSFTVNDAPTATQLFKHGVCAIFSDTAELLI